MKKLALLSLAVSQGRTIKKPKYSKKRSTFLKEMKRLNSNYKAIAILKKIYKSKRKTRKIE